MTAEAQNVAIAEACGVTRHRWEKPDGEIAIGGDPVDLQCERCCQFQSEDPDNWCVLAEIPNYCGDLNAMHGAILSLTPDELNRFARELWLQTGSLEIQAYRHRIDYADLTELITIKACRVAEAFLKTIGRWVDQ